MLPDTTTLRLQRFVREASGNCPKRQPDDDHGGFGDGWAPVPQRCEERTTSSTTTSGEMMTPHHIRGLEGPWSLRSLALRFARRSLVLAAFGIALFVGLHAANDAHHRYPQLMIAASSENLTGPTGQSSSQPAQPPEVQKAVDDVRTLTAALKGWIHNLPVTMPNGSQKPFPEAVTLSPAILITYDGNGVPSYRVALSAHGRISQQRYDAILARFNQEAAKLGLPAAEPYTVADTSTHADIQHEWTFGVLPPAYQLVVGATNNVCEACTYALQHDGAIIATPTKGATTGNPLVAVDSGTAQLVQRGSPPSQTILPAQTTANSPGSALNSLHLPPQPTAPPVLKPLGGIPNNAHVGTQLHTPPTSTPSNSLGTQYYATQAQQQASQQAAQQQAQQVAQQTAQQQASQQQAQQAAQQVAQQTAQQQTAQQQAQQVAVQQQAQQAVQQAQQQAQQALSGVQNLVSQQVANAQQAYSNFTTSVQTDVSSPSWQNTNRAALTGAELLGTAALAALVFA
jgi:hypothetical protein